ncbi:MAG: ABC transporter permease [Euryarchaeota archaeon]|nr:ABC transporter permease [Euryarchaeota archaeon]MCG2738418.1 ABC transporter permease [Candidatus Methanoperedenaceae archaeon]
MKEMFSLAFGQLIRKKLRVFLIVLGIAIGVAAVIGVTSLGEGLRIQAVNHIKASHDLTIIEVSAGLDKGMILLTDSKINDIRKTEHVVLAAQYVKDPYVTMNKTYLTFKGVTKDYKHVQNLQLEKGEWFQEKTNQVVLGRDAAEKLSKIENIKPGDELTVKLRLYGEEGRPRDKTAVFRIVGVMRPTGGEHDNQVMLDINKAREMDEKEAYDGAFVKVDDPAFTSSVRAKIERLGLKGYSAQDEIDAVNKLMTAITLVLGFFSGISLLVGALMIVNTMTISVYERTKEIGLSKALGASDLDIMKMFLAECLIIGIMAGILGILLGSAFSMVIDILGKPFLVSQLGEMGEGLQYTSITAITPSLLAAGFVISLVLSIVAGLYPARRAAKLNPLEALRQI